MRKLFLFTTAVASGAVATAAAVGESPRHVPKNPNDMICRDMGSPGPGSTSSGSA